MMSSHPSLKFLGRGPSCLLPPASPLPLPPLPCSPSPSLIPAQIIRAILSVDHYAVTLMLGGDDEIQRLNREFRGVDSPTDILSFSAVDVVEPEKVPLCKHRELCNLGDLV